MEELLGVRSGSITTTLRPLLRHQGEEATVNLSLHQEEETLLGLEEETRAEETAVRIPIQVRISKERRLERLHQYRDYLCYLRSQLRHVPVERRPRHDRSLLAYGSGGSCYHVFPSLFRPHGLSAVVSPLLHATHGHLSSFSFGRMCAILCMFRNFGILKSLPPP